MPHTFISVYNENKNGCIKKYQKACAICYKKKKRCDRNSTNEKCKYCVRNNAECLNREIIKPGPKRKHED